MKDGSVSLDTENAKPFGFTSDKFLQPSYLWIKGDAVWVSLILSREPGKGHVARLFDAILGTGYTVKVPTPSGMMRGILKAKNFTKTEEETDLGPCEVWVKEP
jgi:hypothetical protein